MRSMSAVLPWRTVAFPPSRHYSWISSSSSSQFHNNHRDYRFLLNLRLCDRRSLNYYSGKLCSSMADSDSSICYSNGKQSSTGSAYAEVVVIRHGETEWNADGRIQGHLDVELNDFGRQQAATVAARLSKEPKITAVYSSDLKRAFETAQIIANSCGKLEVIKDPDLRERHLGVLQGIVFNEAAKKFPEAHLAFVSSSAYQEIPGGGESRDQVYQRVTSCLQRIGNKHKGERVVVVTHGGVIRSLHKRAAQPKKPAGNILNTSVNVFHLSDGDNWTIKSWGDVSHLDQMGFLESGFGGDATSVFFDSICNGNGNQSAAISAFAEIVVIRHGETEWNADSRIQGQLDVELNDIGRQQAAAVAERLSKEPKITAVYSSDLKRAFDTAKMIANKCGGLEVIKDLDLRERHFGDLQGLAYDEANKIWPVGHSTDDQELPGGGESRDQVYRRVTSCLQKIGNKHRNERVVVVTHGGVIIALHKKATGAKPGKIFNTGVNVFHISDGDDWTIKSFGDVTHLDQMRFLESGFGGNATSG